MSATNHNLILLLDEPDIGMELVIRIENIFFESDYCEKNLKYEGVREDLQDCTIFFVTSSYSRLLALVNFSLWLIMAHVILDKSYLDAANKDEIRSLCTEHTVFMPDVLFHELITTKEESMKRCFNKFPNETNPVELIPNIGTLLRYELTTHRPCAPLHEQRVKIVFKFNEGLGDGTFQFTEEQNEIKQNRENQVQVDTKEFFDLAMLVPGFFPYLNNIPFKEFPNAIETAKQQIATDADKVRGIYKSFLNHYTPSNPVDFSVIDSNWAYFRWIQVRVLYSLNLLLKYQGQLPKDFSDKFWRRVEHDLLDSEYVILGSLAGALASNENKMISNFRYICPDGLSFRIER